MWAIVTDYQIFQERLKITDALINNGTKQENARKNTRENNGNLYSSSKDEKNFW